MASDGKVIIDTELNTKDAEKQSKSLGTSLSSGLSKGAKVATAGVMAVGTAVAVVGGKMIQGAKQTAEYGDHIDKMSQKLGLSAKAYQQWDYVAKISGTSIDGLKMGFKTLTNTIDKANQGDEKAIENFKRVGMSMDDLKGKSKEDIFKTTVESLQNMTNETERSAMANKLLGRAGMELGPMLNSSKGSIDELMKKAEDYGMIMSDKAVKASAKFQDSLTTMQMTFTGLKNRMMAEFLPALTQVTDGLSLLFKGDTDKGLEKIEKGVQEFTDKLLEVVPRVLQLGGTIIKGLGTSIIENLPELLNTGLEIGLQLATGIIKALPTAIEQILVAIPTVLNSLSSKLPDIATTLVNGLADAIVSIVTNLPSLLTAGLELATSLIEAIVTAIPNLIFKLIDGFTNPDSIEKFIQGFITLAKKIVESNARIIKVLVDDLPNAIRKYFKALAKKVPEMVSKLKNIVKNVWEHRDEIFQKVKDWFTNLPNRIEEWLKDLPEKAENLGRNLARKMIAGIKAFIEAKGNIAEKIWGYLKDGKIFELAKKMQDLGWEMVKGMFKGLFKIKTAGIKSILKFRFGVLDEIRKAFGIKSPSRVMRDEVGFWMGAGIAEGMAEGYNLYNPMKQINDAVANSRQQIETTAQINSVIDYNRMVDAFADAGLVVQFNDREVARMVRSVS